MATAYPFDVPASMAAPSQSDSTIPRSPAEAPVSGKGALSSPPDGGGGGREGGRGGGRGEGGGGGGVGLGLAPFCVAAYHLRLIIAFSLGVTSKFVWGGCMLYRTEDLAPTDRYGLVAAWRYGGYSDDLIASSVAMDRGLTISCVPSAILLQDLDPCLTFRSYWNYVRRQVFVLDTYTSKHNRTVNHALLAVVSPRDRCAALPAPPCRSTTPPLSLPPPTHPHARTHARRCVLRSPS